LGSGSFKFLRNEMFSHLVLLSYLTRNLEESWFGSWKCLLLGELLNCKNYELVLKNLVNDLRSKCKLDVNEGLLKIILGGSKYVCDGKTLDSQLCSKKGCYIAKVGYCDEARKGILLNAANGFGMSSEVAFELLSDALNVLEVDGAVNREPIILVLDYEVQVSELFLTHLLCSYELILSIKVYSFMFDGTSN